jgi:hypothetical protein
VLIRALLIIVNQKVLVKQLKKIGCTVSVANDGIEALALLEETHYRKKEGLPLSVILMDLEMPNMVTQCIHSILIETTLTITGRDNMCARNSKDGSRRKDFWPRPDHRRDR